jgi:hypothetical protein
VGLEEPVAPAHFASFREALEELLSVYPGPVLAIHGDTHRYRFDQPLRDPVEGGVVERFFRLEVPGGSRVGGVRVSVETDGASTTFRVEPAYADPRDDLLGDL